MKQDTSHKGSTSDVWYNNCFATTGNTLIIEREDGSKKVIPSKENPVIPEGADHVGVSLGNTRVFQTTQEKYLSFIAK